MKKKSFEIKIKKPTKGLWTDAQWVFADAYWFGDAETRGNAFKSYLLAYPNQSEETARAHAFDKVKEKGVISAYQEMKKQYDLELMQKIDSNPNAVDLEFIALELSNMIRNTPHPITQKRPFKENTQLKAMEIYIEKILKPYKENVNLTPGAIQININEVNEPEKIKDVIDITEKKPMLEENDKDIQ